MDTKQQLLTLLSKNKDEYLSGEEIAGTLNVSRAAINKAVKALRAEGNEIDAIRNRGYRLIRSDVINAQAIKELLTTDSTKLSIEVHPTLSSTNVTAREKAGLGASECVIIAANQTGGKGRKGRSFYSPQGSGIYMSILLRPHEYSAAKAASLTTMAAVAVCEAIEKISDKAAQIKWVNDVFIDGKKVCGILTEASMDMESGSLDYAVVGIGINVCPPQGGFPDELKDIAGVIFDEPPFDAKNRIIAEVINRFMAFYTAQSTAYVDEYRSRSLAIGKEVLVLGYNTQKKAFALDVDDDCHLIVRYKDGKIQALSSGEISIRL